MEILVLDPLEQTKLRNSRAMSDADKYDEVWDGVYIVSPLPTDEHQGFVSQLNTIF